MNRFEGNKISRCGYRGRHFLALALAVTLLTSGLAGISHAAMYTLTVTNVGTGAGAIDISDGVTTTTYSFISGQAHAIGVTEGNMVTLTNPVAAAVPAPGSVYKGVSEAAFPMPAGNKSATVTFNQLRKLTIQNPGDGSGTIDVSAGSVSGTGGGSGITMNAAGSVTYNYEHGDVVTLSNGTAAATAYFFGFSGTPATMDSDKTVTATFYKRYAVAWDSNHTVTEAAGATVTFRLTITPAVRAGDSLSLRVLTTASNATSGTDYVAIPSHFETFNPGDSFRDFTITINDDNIVEPQETFWMDGYGDTNKTTPTGLFYKSAYIVNDDLSTVSVSATDNTGAEPSDNGRFTLTMSKASSTATVVSYSVAGTATGDADYTALTGSVTIAANTTTAIIDVATIDDSLVEASETVTVTLTGITSGNSGISVDATPATVTISDDDAATVSITANDAAGAEPADNGQFTVSLNNQSDTATTVSYTVTGDATAGSDYTALTGTVTIPALSASATIDVSVLDDSLLEASETVTVTLNAVTAGDADISIAAAPGNAATVTIADDDTATVSVTANDAAAAEPADGGQFTVSLSKVSDTATTISYTVTGDATAGSDYTALTGTVTIPALSASATIDVAVLDDSLLEASETVTVTLTAVTSGDADISIAAAPNNAATVTIADDDAATVSITANDSSAAEPGDNGQFTVSLSKLSSSATTISYTVTGDAAGGSDYTALTGTVTIAALSASATIDVSVLDEALVEDNETVTVTLTGVTAGDADISIAAAPGNAATVTIADDDAATVSVTANDAAAAEPGDNGQFTVSLSKVSDTATTISYTVSGDAAAGSDYTALSGSITIPANTASGTINVAVLDDSLLEASETVTVTLNAVTAGDADISIAAAPGNAATVTIADDDTATVSVTANDAAAAEPADGGQFTVSLSKVSDTATTISYTVSGDATAGSDYTALSGSITIPANTASGTISVAVLDDSLLEASETVTVTLTAVTSGDSDISIAAAPGNAATVTIADNDAATVSITANDATGAEPADNGQFTVSLSKSSATATTISYAVTGDATAGSDYTALTGTVTIAALSASATIDVSVLDEALVEDNETVTVTLTGITAGDADISIAAAPGNAATVTIADDDAATVSITANDAAAAEPGNNGQFTVSLSNQSDTDTTVSYTVTGDAAAGSDYTALTGTVTIPALSASATIDVSVLNDNWVESSETVTVTLTAVTSGDADISIAAAPNNAATVTIADNDSATVSITANDAAAAEPAGSGQFTVSLSKQSVTATTVSYTVSGDATAGSDYTALTGTVTIAALSASAVIDVSVLDDSLLEASETVTVTLTAVTAGDPDISIAAAPDNAATVTISDNDAATVSITANDAAGAEPSDNGQFTVSLSKLSATATTFSYTVSGDAAAGSDYTALTGTVTIAALSASAVIDVSVIDDSLVEDNETVTVTLTGVTAGDADISIAAAPGNAATVTIADNDSATVSITANDGAGAEPADNGQFTVSLSNQSDTATTVSYTVTGDAAAGSDYTALTGTVTIPALSASAMIDVSVIDDALIEDNETVTVTLNAVTAGDADIGIAAAPGNAATVTISDNDAATVSIAANDATGAEPSDNGQFTVSLSNLSDTATTVSYTVSGDAAAGSDYTALTGTVTIPALSASATIDVSVLNDVLVEPSETVTVTLTGVTAGDADIGIAAAPGNAATVTIADNDAATVSITANDATGAEPADNGQFTVSLSKMSSSATTISYAVTGDATAGSDYTALTGTVTIAALSASATIDVLVLDDALVEDNETVTVTLTGVTAGDADIGIAAAPNNAATVTIADDDAATVSVTANDAAAAEPGDNGQFTVSLSKVSDTATTIGYTVTGDAAAGSDYTALTGTVTIVALSASATIDVSVLDDALVEASETVTVTLNAVTAGDADISIAAAPGNAATVTISDDDQFSLSLIDPGPSVTEGGNINFTVSLTGSLAKPVTVSFVTSDGTATTADNDYTAVNTTQTFPAGAITGDQLTFSVSTGADSKNESDETFTVTVGSADASFDGNAVTGTGTILDNDFTLTFLVSTITNTGIVGGSVSGAGVFSVIVGTDTVYKVDVQDGNSATLTAVPAAGYRFRQWVQGIGSFTDTTVNPLTVTNVTENKTIVAVFVKQYTVTPTAGAGGAISPAVPETIDYLTDSSVYTLLPDPGFHVADLTVNGASVGALSTYQVMAIDGDKAIHATFASPTAAFTAIPTSGNEPLVVTLEDQSTTGGGTSITQWVWNFGDGQSLTVTNSDDNPRNHLYAQEGVFTLTLTVTNSSGVTDSAATVITVTDTDPVAAFDTDFTTGNEPLTVNFVSTSTSYDGIVSYAWNFGDAGATAATQNASHTYNQNGTYTVTLTVTEADGDTSTSTATITVIDPGPTPDFVVAPVIGDIPLVVTFTNAASSHDGIFSVTWDFGDGSPQIFTQDSAHTYTTAGIYTASLTVVEVDGDSATKTVQITAKQPVFDPDGDSDGWTVGQGDCNDSDASINPGAAEIANDGIDQDCYDGDRITSGISACIDISDSPLDVQLNAAKPNIMFVMDDSGSMDWEFLTKYDEGVYWLCQRDATGQCKINATTTKFEVTSANYYYLLPESLTDNLWQQSVWPALGFGNSDTAERRLYDARFYKENVLYYNPNYTYEPWYSYTNANVDNPKTHPYRTQTFDIGDTLYTVAVAAAGGGASTIIVDNQDGAGVFSTSGSWSIFSDPDDYNGKDSYTSQVGAYATWSINVTTAGNYEVLAYLDPDYNYFKGWDRGAEYRITHAGTTNTVTAAQGTGNGWVSLGQYNFDTTNTSAVRVKRVDNKTANGAWTGADAIKLVSGGAGAGSLNVPYGHYFTFNDTNTNGNLDSGEDIYLVAFIDTDGNDAIDARKFYKFTDTDKDMRVDDNELSLIDDTNVPAALKSMTYTEDLQNYANWFQYYRKRWLTAVAAITKVIPNLTNVYAGVRSINGNIRLGVVPINVAGQGDQTMTLINAFQQWAQVRSPASTPLRDGLDKVGLYFHQTETTGSLESEFTTSPISTGAGGECQQNFALVFTDGAWNGGASGINNVDGDYGPPFADAYSNTLADIAMKFYVNDLAPTVANSVPTNFYDKATWQHMVTYGITFGVNGTLDPANYDLYNIDPAQRIYPTWPDPKSGPEAARIDDVWHASVNGRGKYLSAQNPQELVTYLEDAINDIIARIGSGASVSINGEELNAGTIVYQSLYSTESWTGDVKAYQIDINTGEVVRDSYVWSAEEELFSTNWNTGRVIATFNGIGGIPFRWDATIAASATTTAQTTALFSQLNASPAVAGSMVNYLRGDSSGEVKYGGGYRNRDFKLPDETTRDTKLLDIVHSAPLFFSYYDSTNTPHGVIYAGGNDGMLHAFDAVTGQELFAYVPKLVYDNLAELTTPSYGHKYYVDLTPFAKNMGTQSILVGGLGKGGRGYYALNITDLSDVVNAGSIAAGEAALASRVMWEFPSNATLQADIDDLGYTYSRAPVVNSNEGWIVIFGNGYNSPNGKAVLFILNAATGTVLRKIDTGAGTCNGLSTPTPIDINNDGKVDYVFAGDLKGNVWKFDLTSASAEPVVISSYPGWDVAYFDTLSTMVRAGEVVQFTPAPVFTAKDSAGNVQPITAKPDVMRHPEYPTMPGYIVVFGTGQYLGVDDFSDTSTQTVYGIWDYGDDADNREYPGAFNRSAAIKLSNLSIHSSMMEQTQIAFTTVNGKGLRILSDNVLNWVVTNDPDSNGQPNPSALQANHVGWFFDLPQRKERMVRDVLIRDNKAIIISSLPNTSACSAGGESVLHEMNAGTGGRLSVAQFDINDDGIVDENDLIAIANPEYVSGVQVFDEDGNQLFNGDGTPAIYGDQVLDENGNPILDESGNPILWGSEGGGGRYRGSKPMLITVAPTGVSYPTMIYPPTILDTGQDEIKLMSTAAGGIIDLRERRERKGMAYWKQIE